MTKPYIDYSEAISKGVYNWLDANSETVKQIVTDAVAKSTERSIEYVAAGVMAAVGKFLDVNADDLKTGIAAAIATSWASRQHPVLR